MHSNASLIENDTIQGSQDKITENRSCCEIRAPINLKLQNLCLICSALKILRSIFTNILK